MRKFPGVLTLLVFFSLNRCQPPVENYKTYGWALLYGNTEFTDLTIETGKNYGINQLLLSGDVCSNLSDLRNPYKKRSVNMLIKKARNAGITEVVVSDKGFYDLDYYPDRFRIGETGNLNFDNPELWEWIKSDYRELLDFVAEADGIVLDLSESRSLVGSQFSDILKTPAEKNAALADSLAGIVVGEKNKKLYLRGFNDYSSGLKTVADCYKLIKSPGIIVIEKEVPQNFISTHPVSEWIQEIPFPVLIEFDVTHKFDGQNIVASIFPGLHLEHWQYYQKLPNVAGFSILTAGLGGESAAYETPGEINVFAICESAKNPLATTDEVLAKFIAEKYGPEIAEYLKPAFEKAPEIILSSFYTLGLNTTDYSRLDFENPLTYSVNVSGRWMENPVIKIGHNVDMEFNYWSDIVNHLAPPKYKQPDGILSEWPELFADSLIQTEELMDSTWLNYILAEKKYGVQLAKEALVAVKAAKPHLYYPSIYNTLHHLFARTLITARLREAYAQVYFGARVWQRGKDFQYDPLLDLIRDGVDELSASISEMEGYSEKGPEGTYSWAGDAEAARKLIAEIKKSGILPKSK